MNEYPTAATGVGTPGIVPPEELNPRKAQQRMFAGLPLTVKMVAAADVLESARTEFHSRPENQNSNWMAIGWTAANLRKYAQEWEAAAEAERQERRAVEELAELLRGAEPCSTSYYELAQAVVNAGWKKEEES